MKIEIVRLGIEIIPETDHDVAFIEDTIGMKKDGDSLEVIRYDTDNIHREKNLSTLRSLTLNTSIECLGIRSN